MKNYTSTALILILLIVAISIMPVWAQWADNGVSVCNKSGAQRSPRIISKPGGGAIVVWEDSRGSYRNIFVQRIDVDGNPVWEANGIAVSAAAGDQWTPQVVTDGAGGAIVVWADFRSGNFNVYAQRLNSDGLQLWTSGGVLLCSDSQDQWTPVMTADGAGGALIAWADHRKGDYDIYAQRINASGSLVWQQGGLQVCTDGGRQDYPDIVADGSGGVVISWEDRRDGQRDIYAQRIDVDGTAGWTANGVPVCSESGNQYQPHLVSDGAEGAIIVWYDQRSGDSDIYAQRIDSSGVAMWGSGGEVVCTAASGQEWPSICADGNRGAIIAWEDRRSSARDIYAQRMGPGGEPLWEANGIAVCTAINGQWSPAVVPDGTGGAIVSWDDYRFSNYDIFAQRVAGSGVMLWPSGGVPLCSASGSQWTHHSVGDGASGAIFVWEDNRTGGDYDIYVNRVNADGGTYVATLLQNWSAHAEGPRVVIEWRLSGIDEGADLLVERSLSVEGPYSVIDARIERVSDLSFSAVDKECGAGKSYWYRVAVVTDGERRVLFGTGQVKIPTAVTVLRQNYPNPFNPVTTIEFYLPEGCQVTIDIYDVAGRSVARIENSFREAGSHQTKWNGKDRLGRSLSSGIYFYSLRAGKTVLMRKMIIVR